MQYKRKMGIDYGDKRIGIAFSDLLGMFASAKEVYFNENIDKSAEYISNLANKMDVDEIIIGLPLNMQGEENDRTKLTREFGDVLKRKSGLVIKYEDERLSSVEAEEILKKKKLGWEDRKKILDMYSAQVILQSYLDSNKK